MSVPVVLTFVGNYLPGYRSGGILRSLANLVEHLGHEFDFRIVTRDRDLGANEPYDSIEFNRWGVTDYGNLYYLTPDRCTISAIREIVSETPHDILYLNSFFDSLTVYNLYNRWRRAVPRRKTIVSPRGEFGWASLRQKYPKKLAFITLARAMRLYSGVTWHASSEIEAQEIVEVMGSSEADIHVAPDLPLLRPQNDAVSGSSVCERAGDQLRVVFLSRIAREKNLDYALDVLKGVKVDVRFDIYGPADNVAYWEYCQSLVPSLPRNITVRYYGPHPEPLKVLCSYDLLLLPSGGENYGQVIAEALITGTPVLISDKTPWRNLEPDGLGWDVPLSDKARFIEIIEKLALTHPDELDMRREEIREKVWERLTAPGVLDANRKLFCS